MLQYYEKILLSGTAGLNICACLAHQHILPLAIGLRRFPDSNDIKTQNQNILKSRVGNWGWVVGGS